MMIPVAAAFAALTGLALGTPVLRLRGDYLAIVTLGFGEIVRILINNNAFGVTNGAAGLPRAGVFLPKPLGLEWLQNNTFFTIPNLGANGFNFSFSIQPVLVLHHRAALLLTIFVVAASGQLPSRPLVGRHARGRGRRLVDGRQHHAVAKLWAFSLGAVWGGIAGVTFANFQQFVSPESFTFMESVFVVCAVVIGGMGSIPGRHRRRACSSRASRRSSAGSPAPASSRSPASRSRRSATTGSWSSACSW